jgi:hypothetical protein
LPLTTKQLAELLGTNIDAIGAKIRRGLLTPPGKDPFGNFLWHEADAERARQALTTDYRRRGLPRLTATRAPQEQGGAA